MSKRKRDDSRDHNRSDLTQNKIERILEWGSQSLARDFKLARGFERQKLGRRQKAANVAKDEATIKRLASEVTALKNMSLSYAGDLHLYRSIAKTRSLASAPGMPRHIVEKGERQNPFRDPASANVFARLVKSAPVRNSMDDILLQIRGILGIPILTKQNPIKSRREGKKRDGLRQGTEWENIPGHDTPTASNEMDDDNQAGGFSHSSSVSGSIKDLNDKHATAESVGMSKAFSQRLGSISMDELVDSEDQSSKSSFRVGATRHPDSEDEGKQIPGLSEKTVGAPKISSKSLFLPSLSAGGYISGSEPDLDEDDTRPGRRAPRKKNRPGQQARRARWEQVYGIQARHLQKGRDGRDQGWDTRRGAFDDGSGGSGRISKGYRQHNQQFAGQGESRHVGPNLTRQRPLVQEDKPLHPSWAAAKKIKQNVKASFKGTKITFD